MTDQIKVYILYGFIVVFALCSCRSVKTDAENKDSLKIEIHDAAMLRWDSAAFQSFRREAAWQTDDDFVMDLTIYNLPDSAGQQSVLAKATVTNRRSEASQQLEHHNKDETRQTEAVTSHDGKAERHLIQTEKKTRDPRSSAIKMWLSLALLMLLLFFIIKNRKWLHS